MRGELFILPVDLLEAMVIATEGQMPPDDLTRIYGTAAGAGQKIRDQGNAAEVSNQEIEDYKSKIVKILETECLTIEQLKKKLGTNINLSHIVYSLCDSRVLARGATVRWDNNKHHYTAWANWLPHLTLDMPREQAQAVLIRNYIRSYGPVCLEDILWWTGIGKPEIMRQMKDLAGEMVEMSIDCFEGKFYICKEHFARLKAMKYLDEPLVNLLPSQDSYIVAYRRRGRHSMRDIYPKVHDRAGNILPVVLIDGQVEGIWDYRNNRVEYALLHRVDGSTQQEVKQKARSLTEFLRSHI